MTTAADLLAAANTAVVAYGNQRAADQQATDATAQTAAVAAARTAQAATDAAAIATAAAAQATAEQAATDAQTQLTDAQTTITTLETELEDCQTDNPSTARFPGDPGEGRMYFGSSFAGVNAIQCLQREVVYGATATVHRTFYNLTTSGIATAVAMCKADNAAGRMSWISFKLPKKTAASGGNPASTVAVDYDWFNAGHEDALLTALTVALAALPFPIMLTMHHEPEDDGETPAQWTAMQQKVSPVIMDGAPNVAFGPIRTYGGMTESNGTTGWGDVHTYPGDGIWHFEGVDIYPGRSQTVQPDIAADLAACKALADVHDLPLAIGEWGYKPSTYGSGGNTGAILRAPDQMLAAGVFCASYFDSDANSIADWTLDGPRLAEFAVDLKRADIAHVIPART